LARFWAVCFDIIEELFQELRLYAYRAGDGEQQQDGGGEANVFLIFEGLLSVR